jgi:hypothetical protein
MRNAATMQRNVATLLCSATTVGLQTGKYLQSVEGDDDIPILITQYEKDKMMTMPVAPDDDDVTTWW